MLPDVEGVVAGSDRMISTITYVVDNEFVERLYRFAIGHGLDASAPSLQVDGKSSVRVNYGRKRPLVEHLDITKQFRIAFHDSL